MKDLRPDGFSIHWRSILTQTTAFSRNQNLHNVVFFGTGSFFAQLIMAVNAILLARHLKPDGYGLFISAYAAAGLSSFLFNWGLDTWMLRQAAITKDLARILGGVFVIKIVLGILWCLSLVAFLPNIRPDVFLTPLVLVSGLDLLVDGLFTAQIAALNALKRSSVSASLLLLSRSARLASTIVLILLDVNSPVTFAQGRLTGTLLALTITFLVFRPRFVINILAEGKAIIKESIPYGFSDLLAIVYLQVDVTMLGIILGDEHAVGLYAPASGIISALFVVPSAVYTVLIPILTRHHQGEISRFRSSITIMFASFLILGVVMSLGVWGGGKMATDIILGHEYTTTGRVLVLLSPILFFKATSFASATFLVAVGWQHYRLGPQVIAALANILLNLIFIPLLGIWGVAIVYIISEILLSVGYFYLTVKWFKIKKISLGSR